jgi:DNA-directed RNA polymerase specialized sigma24 family protein
MAGEARAWQELCRVYAEPLYLFIFHRNGGDAQAAEDARQETLLAAVEAIGGYRRQVPLFGWLCGILATSWPTRHDGGGDWARRSTS